VVKGLFPKYWCTLGFESILNIASLSDATNGLSKSLSVFIVKSIILNYINICLEEKALAPIAAGILFWDLSEAKQRIHPKKDKGE
jgi:hypothetical protein